MPEMHLESDTFARMNSLRFLKFYHPFYFMDSKDKVHLPLSGLKYLSDELRYLHWHRFPAKSLPQNFCAENIVDLTLHSSRVEKLWTGVQDLLNLRWIDLSRSTHLLEIPDLSRAKNLKYIDLSFCESLLEVHSSIQHLEKLEILILSGCKNLGIVPKTIESKFLRILDLSHCKNVRKCPEISGYLEELMLQGTAIEELPQSISKVKEIRILDLSGCSNITKFPQISGNIKQLRLLWTVIEEIGSEATLGRYTIENSDPPTELQCNRIFICECHARGENDEHHDVLFNLSTCAYELRSVESDQMLLLYNPCEFVKRDCISQYSGKEISFEFYLDEPSRIQNRCKVKRCGVYLMDE
uniref:TMV resistance protein N-like n=1 Tax=Populus alba TaxID=43335 RepID=A0A4U5NNF7_POPAL|nr:hypothetical protein D5086_0000257540 [Populus alba]